MTVHLISVGVSMLDAMEHPDRKGLADGLCRAFGDTSPYSTLAFGFGKSERAVASDWVASALEAPGEPGRDPRPAGQLRDLAAALDLKRWPNSISAEIETFRAASGKRFPLSRDDIAVLICSDTPRGLLAGVWNTLALTEGDFSRVMYSPEPGTALADLRGKAVLVRVAGMDAASRDGFTTAMSGLGMLACRLLEAGCVTKDDDFRFYLSGGFKAAIPYLIAMAEAIRSLDETRLKDFGAADLKRPGRVFPVKAFVLHEMTDPPKPIELPLRRLPASVIRQELAGYTGKTRIGKPVPALLEGYAYEVAPDGKTCTLTPFGEGLKILFNVPPEGYIG
jgi:hypothetical protein